MVNEPKGVFEVYVCEVDVFVGETDVFKGRDSLLYLSCSVLLWSKTLKCFVVVLD